MYIENQNNFHSDDDMKNRIITRLRTAGCVFAEEETQLLLSETRTLEDLEDMVERRVTGFPLEYIIGWANFCGLRIKLEPGVFVPRRRTEFLVQQAAALANKGAIVVDLCCGSGAVGAALSNVLGRIELYAVDIDPASVQCARRNITAIGSFVYEGDLYEPLPTKLQGCIDILVANAPYVPTEAIGLLPQEARIHEARVALDGGSDGLDVQRRVAAEAPLWLVPGGHLLVETSERQALHTVQLFTRMGLKTRVASCEQLDATVVIGTRPNF